MRVIKEGTGQKGWAQNFVCTGNGNNGGGCGAVLLVEEQDLFTTHSSHYDGSNDSYITFQCAQCGVLTDIPQSKAPHVSLPNHETWKKKKKNTFAVLNWAGHVAVHDKLLELGIGSHGQVITKSSLFEIAESIFRSGLNVMIRHSKNPDAMPSILVDDEDFKDPQG